MREGTEAYMEIMQFLREIMRTREEQIDFLLDFVSLGLTGAKNGEMVVFMIGNGSNGKSVLLSLIENTLGAELCGRFDGAYLCHTSSVIYSPEAPTPTLMKLARARFAIASETRKGRAGDVVLDDVALKKICSEEKLYIRGMCKEGTEITPCWKVLVASNHYPTLAPEAIFDRGTTRRIVILDLPISFVQRPDRPLEHHESLRDETLKNKLNTKRWRYAFLGILIRRFASASDRTRPLDSETRIHPKILAFTRRKIADPDYVGEYIESVYIRYDRERQKDMYYATDNRIDTHDFYHRFMSWMVDVKGIADTASSWSTAQR
ncbi:uncharacterized protein BJ171DRAFT_473753 [Polychytrium aggregatum]|uniref:uncharacterized protein n=1 Tax=Polychytrium aggregatum TaxID=110093 RepID=UPI0022FDD153|nr:uncharacterized protein BJ171DRAFT_473753 [Polychytrium aggregatum]KAI9205705.1 hypothetical protein BJ171DRAFT_473753 [Polychytrium aggregatum]